MTERITVNGQNSIRIESDLGVIYVDPFRIPKATKDAAFIFITHDHYDHFSPEDIAMVAGKNTLLILPEKMKGKATEVAHLVEETVSVKPGEQQMIRGLEVETVAAYNLMKPFHPKGAGWVGYIFNINGERIYVAGDTDATAEAKAVKCDIAIIPIGGTYTMDPKQAADYVNTVAPKIAIPVHYGSIVGSPQDGDTFAGLVKEPVKVELKIK